MYVMYRSLAMTVALLLLYGCGSGKSAEDLPPTCPVLGVLADASHVRFYQEGSGREQSDVTYELEFIRGELRECNRDDDKLSSEIRFDIVARKGPAGADDARFTYFVSILGPDSKVVSKELYEHSADFKSDKPEVRFSIEKNDIEITPPEGKDGLGYEILLGFQLSREQLDLNRARGQTVTEPAVLMK